MKSFKIVYKYILLFTLILAIAVSVLSFSSCDRSYDEDEIIAETKELLKKAEVLNEVYFGKGLAFITTGEQNGSYYEADAFHLKSLGFSTVGELRSLTSQTYSDTYTATIFSTKLDSADAGYVRYYQKYANEIEQEDPFCIMVYNNIEVQMDKVVYDYSSISVIGAKGEIVNVEVNATVTNSDGKSQNKTLKLQLIQEEDGWRINNPTHAKYNEYQDLYDELVNNDIG